MNQLLAMRAFRCIVEAKGFSAAAERLDTTHSTISRQLQQLEVELGVQLINRNTRRFSLTSAGEQYYAACVDILDRVDAAAQVVAGEHQRPTGLLRVSVPLVIGTLELGNWLPGFQQRYPDIELELSCSDDLVDLVAERFDLALRITGPLADTTLVARTLVVSDMILVAAHSYVRGRGLPRTAQALDQHRLLAYSSRSGVVSDWQLEAARSSTIKWVPSGKFKADTISGLYAAVLAGVGIAAFTRATVQAAIDSGQLVHILPQYTLGQRHYYALYPHAKHLPAKVRAFVDFMADHYGAR
ncbi:MAG: LysR family transcriptional regulator [Pseudomonas sp.]